MFKFHIPYLLWYLFLSEFIILKCRLDFKYTLYIVRQNFSIVFFLATFEWVWVILFYSKFFYSFIFALCRKSVLCYFYLVIMCIIVVSVLFLPPVTPRTSYNIFCCLCLFCWGMIFFYLLCYNLHYSNSQELIEVLRTNVQVVATFGQRAFIHFIFYNTFL